MRLICTPSTRIWHDLAATLFYRNTMRNINNYKQTFRVRLEDIHLRKAARGMKANFWNSLMDPL